MVHEMTVLFRQWRDGVDREGNPCPNARDRRERLSPYSTQRTPPMGGMTDEQIGYYAREICRRDMERTINRRLASMPRAKSRASEAA